MKYLITGGTGSLDQELVEYITQEPKNSSELYNRPEVIVFSRDEQKQFNMKVKYSGMPNKIHYVLGDVRDYDSVDEVMAEYKPHVVIHTAAQKHVQECDSNPMQAVKTNIEGTKNIGKACIIHNVRSACFISTDKAPNPTTLYGMTKYIAERLWVNFSKRSRRGQFTGVRYGNILNSAGSLIPLYQRIAEDQDFPEFPLTSPHMTRFFLTYTQAIALIMLSLPYVCRPLFVDETELDRIVQIRGMASELFLIPEALAATVGDIASIFAEKYGGKVVPRDMVEGEKMHEILLPDYCSKDHVISKTELHNLFKRNGII